MSTRTFVNALIGLSREYKKKERLAKKHQSTKASRYYQLPAFGREVAEMMQEGDYFPADQAEVFGDALEEVLRNSDPRRIK